MSQENVETLKRAFDAFASGDLETVFAFIDPEFEINDRVIGSPSARGTEALIANAAEVREAVGDVSWEPREIVDLDDRALVKVHVAGAGQHTSLPIEGDVGHIYTFLAFNLTPRLLISTRPLFDSSARATSPPSGPR